MIYNTYVILLAFFDSSATFEVSSETVNDFLEILSF